MTKACQPSKTDTTCSPMHVHLIAVAGTGMGALAGLFKELGHDVSGSDVRFDPPMGPALEKWGIRLMQGFDPAHLDPAPDLVVIGNVCRSNNPEARAAIDRGLPYTDMAHGLADLVLEAKTPVVIAGTHGKTTTSSLAAWLLFDAGKDPGMLIGGLPKNFEHSFRIPSRKGPGLPLADHPMPTRRTPFVIEGDEYDTAFFEKTPKFWHYRPEIAVITSIEYDHIDIYPTFEAYLHAFATFVERIPSSGLLVASAASQTVVDVVSQHARCEVIWYALQGENWHGCTPHYLGALAGA
ncbi:MAG TPA: Mur ligase family protein, partial [Polyangiaceae bacterium]|nr:Mur ligase family protein [Polyangiaceae bacterium]